MRSLRLAPAAALLLVACCTARPHPRADVPARIAPPAAAAGPADAAPPAPPDAAPLDEDGLPDAPPAVAELTPWLGGPELADAVADFHAGRNHPAARVLEAWADAHPGTVEGRAARFLALLARHDGGVFDPTAADLEAMADAWPLLADYARFYAGSSHLHAGRPAEARALLAAVPPESTLWPRAVELEAEALAAEGDRPAALARLEAAVKRLPDERGPLWEQLAALRREAGDEAGARDALRELASRFATRESGRRGLAALGDDPGFTTAQWLRLGRAWFGAQAHDRALEALGRVVAAAPAGSDAWCEAQGKLARTWEKKKDRERAWRAFEKALGCKGTVLADATFAGGRNRLAVGDLARAEKLLEQHVATFGSRSTVDDAALMLAEIARKRGDDAAADARLLDNLARWPDGDMVDDASWALLWPRLDGKRWEEAVATADAILARVPRETSYRAEGRTLYWKARALAHLGRAEEAAAAWRLVVDAYPLTWYGLLAHARLAEADPAAAAAAVRAALESARPGPDPLAQIPEALWADEHFRKGVALARMGLVDSARRELSAVAAAAHDGDRDAWVWTRVALYDLVGAWDAAVGLARREEPRLASAWPVGPSRRLWELAHPRAFRDLVERWAGERGIDPFWVYAIAREESGFDPRIESWANAIGLMQIILPTAKMLARGTDLDPTPADLRRPEIAIELGTKYLANLLARHPALPLASAGYNAGGGAVAKWRRAMGDLELDELVERIPYREARGYAKRVTRSVARYTWLYGGERVLAVPLAPPGPP